MATKTSFLSTVLFKSVRTFSTTKRRKINVCDQLPSATLYRRGNTKVDVNYICCGQKLLIFGVVGAFTPGCSKTHLPGYVEKAEQIKNEKCIEHIYCVSVNDPFVMDAWGDQNNVEGKVQLLADPCAEFVKALNLTIDVPTLGGIRAKRFSMIVDNNQVIELNVEPDGTGLTCSLADKFCSKSS